jgi:hypothetical protein
MTQNYDYTTNDLLKNPQKYQMTKYEGTDFLLAYKNQRNEIIKILNQQKIFTLDEIMNEFVLLNSLENLYKNSPILLSKLLSILISQYFTLQNSDLFLEILNILIKKFEIKKKLYSKYDLDFKEISTSYDDLLNYEKLSLLALLHYDKTKNLKFLNVALKINDTLSSQIQNMNKKNEKLLMFFILKLELQYVTKLCEIKRIL